MKHFAYITILVALLVNNLSSQSLVLFDEAADLDPFPAKPSPRSTASITLADAYVVAGSHSSSTEGLRIFEIIKEELKGKEDTILKIKRRSCDIASAKPEAPTQILS